MDGLHSEWETGVTTWLEEWQFKDANKNTIAW